MASVKIGKTWFNTDVVKKMTFKEFESTFSHLQIEDMKGAFKQLGGKLTNKKKKDDPVRPSE